MSPVPDDKMCFIETNEGVIALAASVAYNMIAQKKQQQDQLGAVKNFALSIGAAEACTTTLATLHMMPSKSISTMQALAAARKSRYMVLSRYAGDLDTKRLLKLMREASISTLLVNDLLGNVCIRSTLVDRRSGISTSKSSASGSG